MSQDKTTQHQQNQTDDRKGGFCNPSTERNLGDHQGQPFTFNIRKLRSHNKFRVELRQDYFSKFSVLR